MKSQISPQDYERLSAFLDGELKGAAGREFQARVEKDSGLNAALEDLRNIRALVREMPRRRAPRSFTLTPEMVEAHKPAFFALAALRSMQFSAVLSGILLVLVLAGDLFLNRYGARPALPAAAPVAAVQKAAPPTGEVAPNGLANATAIEMPQGEFALDQALAPLATTSATAAVTTEAIATGEIQALEAAPPGVMPHEPALSTPSSTPSVLATSPAVSESKKTEEPASPVPAIRPETSRPPAPSPLPKNLFIEIVLAAILLFSIGMTLLIRRNISRK